MDSRGITLLRPRSEVLTRPSTVFPNEGLPYKQDRDQHEPSAAVQSAAAMSIAGAKELLRFFSYHSLRVEG